MSSPRDPFQGSGGLPEVLWSSKRSLYGGDLLVLDLLTRETHGFRYRHAGRLRRRRCGGWSFRPTGGGLRRDFGQVSLSDAKGLAERWAGLS
ncbi:MAG: hypothetical protein OXB97_04565 [Rhodospirillales bacterium]|nr:hypothetical protein [Rhodospirillales bacterium]